MKLFSYFVLLAICISHISFASQKSQNLFASRTAPQASEKEKNECCSDKCTSNTVCCFGVIAFGCVAFMAGFEISRQSSYNTGFDHGYRQGTAFAHHSDFTNAYHEGAQMAYAQAARQQCAIKKPSYNRIEQRASKAFAEYSKNIAASKKFAQALSRKDD